MNHQEATKHAQSFFANYPKIDAFHVTTDGQVFEEKHHAQSHADTLKDKSVHHVERESEEQKSESVKHIIIQEDLTANPELEAEGIKVGDEIEIPVKKKQEKAQDSKAKEAAEKKAAAIKKSAETKAKNAAAKAGK